jgi:predicted Rossmann fold flavoprotein
VPLKAEGEKVYPYSLQASSVLDMLRFAEGMQEVCDTEIVKIIPKNKGYILKNREKEYFFDKVILACGGKASPNLSGGGAYSLLTDLGHKLTPLKPAIVQLKCDGTKALDGVKVDAKVKMDKRVEEGEVLFTSYGLSGPPILQLSRDAKGKTVSLDLTPDLSYNEIVNMLYVKKKLSYLTLENLFTGFLNKKLGREILKRCNVLPFTKNVSELTDKEIKSLAGMIKGMEFLITDTNGFQNAQVTAGGIDTRDFNPETMESKLCPGIFATGEMLDVDGDCGGFNLQWAFSSAYLAALSAIGDIL